MKSLLYLYLLVFICFSFITLVNCDSEGGHWGKSAKQSKRTYLGQGFEIVGGYYDTTDTHWSPMSYNNLGDSYSKQQYKEITLRNCGVKTAKNYIVGGEDAVEHEFPFIVSLLFNGKMSCGAAIINKWWIITAAHCFIGRQHLISSFSLVTGAHRYSIGQKYRISRLIVHEKFNEEIMHSDIALIKVDRQIAISSKVNGICLPAKNNEESSGVLTVAGWGKLRFGEQAKGSETLLKVKLPIISDKLCSNMFANQEITIYRSYICTHAIGKDACEGDSGGPAFQYINGKAVLIGIVSFGYECADNYPGVYTQVSWYLNWISDNIS